MKILKYILIYLLMKIIHEEMLLLAIMQETHLAYFYENAIETIAKYLSSKFF